VNESQAFSFTPNTTTQRTVMYNEEIEEGRRHSVHQPLQPPPPALAQRARQVITVIAFISFFSLGGLVGVTGPAIPSLAIHLGHRDETQLGSAFTCRGSGYLCGAFLASVLDHRWPKGKHIVMVIGSLLAGLATLGAAFTSSFSVFLPVMALQGLGLGCVDTAANAVLIELWGGTKYVEQLMQAMHACFGIGAVASPAAVGGLGYVVAFVLCATVALLPLLVWTGDTVVREVGGGCGDEKALGSEVNMPRQEDGGEEDGLTQSLIGKQDVVSAAAAAVAAAEAAATTTTEITPALPPLPLWPRLSISFFLLVYVGIEVGFGGWIATYLLREHLTDSTRTASYSVSLFWGTITLGRLLAVPLALHLPPPRFLLLQLSITTLGVVLLLTVGPSTLWGASLASALFGLGMSSIFPSMMLLPETLGFKLDMKSTSAFMIGACVGEGVVPVGIGWVMGGGGGEGGTARFPWAVAGACGVMWVVLIGILKGWTGGKGAMVVVTKEEGEKEGGGSSGGG